MCKLISSITFLIFLTQRREFINGEAEPTDAESEWHSENEEEEKLAVSTSWVMNCRCIDLSELIPVQCFPLQDSSFGNEGFVSNVPL